MKNDWIIANLNNPDFTTADFKNIGGFTLENTELLPKEKYLESDKILQNPVFQDESGQFSKKKFDNYYNNLAEKYGNFQHDSNIDNYEYGFWDVFQKPTSRVKNPQFTLDKVANPTHQSWGVLGVNVQGEKTKSDLELAEKQKIYDWEEGKFKDETPESSALFSNPFKFIKNIFSEPLVLAKYDEDTDEIDPLTGILQHHKKGENKTNSEGEFYFETLGGRSLLGKQVLSLGDVLTKEDSAVNKYDFFDSDDLEKSPEGVIAKNLAAIAPVLFLGPVGTSIYGGLYVARELLKTLPMMERVGTILSSQDSDETSTLNTLAAYGQKFTGGTSEYSKQKTFSFENFGNLISDVALQWVQQKAIAETITKLFTSNKTMLATAEGKALAEYEKQANSILNQAYAGKLPILEATELTGAENINGISRVIQSGNWKKTVVGNKAIEQALSGVRDSYAKKQKLGQDLSLVYMSMISNTDVYDSAIEHGATKQEAAAVALGSMIGMFSVDKYLGLGEMFFDDAKAQQRRLYRKLLKDHYDNDVAPVITSLASKPTTEETKTGILNFFKLGKNKTVEFLKDYHSDIKDRALGIVGKSIGEGLEEVSEEAVTDLVKSLYQLAGDFGWVSQKNIGAFDNMKERYLMSLFGGAIGGGIFGGIDAIKNPQTTVDLNSRDAMLTLIRQEGSSNIIKELDRMRDQGKLGSTELSINTQEIESEDGQKQRIFVKADKENISQNDFNYNQMKTAIQQMEKIINANQLNISDDKLFERMITSDFKLDSLKQYLKDASYISGYYQDYQNLVNDIWKNESDIEDLRNSSDPKKRTEQYEEDLQKLLEKRDELNKRKEDFFTNKTQRYLKKTMFAINPSISGLFLPITFEDYVQKEYKKPVQFVSKNDLEEAQQKYDDWVKTKKVQELDEAFEAFEQMSKKILPILQEYKESDIESWENVRKELAKNFPQFEFVPNYDTRIISKQINVDEKLKTLKIIKGEEYDKPWKTDPTKTNKAFDLQLEEDPTMFFQIVKDHEDGNWSIHFKTDNPDVKGPKSILSDDQKNRLFEAAATVIPEGDRISTWGSLTRGGISGINRFGKMPGFKKVGERKVSLKAGQKQVQVVFDENSIPSLETLKNENHKEIRLPILRSRNGSEISLGIVYDLDGDNIDINFSGTKDAFLIDKNLIPESSSLRDVSNNPDFDFENLEDYGKIVKISKKDGQWVTAVEYNTKNPEEDGTVTEYFQGLLAPELVPQELREGAESSLTLGTTYNAEEELTIPIFQKQSGETDEEYNNRNKQLEGESDEDFAARQELRKQQLQLQYTDFLINSIQQLINSNAVIDPNTFRYIMANMGFRIKDLKKAYTKLIGQGTQVYDKFQEILGILNDDLSNVEDVWKQIQTKIIEHTNEWFVQTYPNAVKISTYDGLKNHQGIHTIQDIINYVQDNTEGFIDLDKNLEESGLEEIYNLITEDLQESYEAYSVIDRINLERANGNPVKLYNPYTITLDNGEIITTNPNSEITDINILNKIREQIWEEYPSKVPVGYSEEFYNSEYQKNEKAVKNNFDSVIGQLQRDSRYTVLRDLQQKLEVKEAPIHKLLKVIASKLGEDYGSIEDTLQSIYEQYDNLAEAADFTLSESQIQALEKAQHLIELATSVIIAASEEDSYSSPWPYNKTINEWNKEHRSELESEIEELPEISKDLANISLSSLLQYSSEINSWLTKAKGNRINKIKMFKEFDTKFEQVKLKFFMDNKDKWITEDGINLLEGFQEQDNPKNSVLEAERILFKNVQNLLKNGKNISIIFDAFKDSINWEQAATQKTSKLDVNLNELTDYDKFIYFATCIGLSPDNFYIEYKKFVESNKENIAPLSFQKHIIRVQKAVEHSPNLFNQLLELFKTEANLKDLPILYNTVILTGIGGAGKSSVCGKSVINKDSWVVGPTDTQINNLKELAPNLTSYHNSKLLKLILEDQYDEQTGINKDLITETPNPSGGNADISRLKIKTFDNPPSNIILDETTLASNAELQVISKWCKLNNVVLYLMGDENQNGNDRPGNNIARETTVAIRTPKMQLSLRDANIWKYYNQQTLMNLEDSLRDTVTQEETTLVRDRLKNTDLPKFSLKYYFKDGKLTGDMITSEVTDDQIQTLNKEVKFIGSESSPVYQKLKAAGKVSKAYSLKEIQGQESAYIVADIDWNSLYKKDGNAFQLLDFMRNLYTVITRSKEGSIIVDNGLSSIIKGSSPQSYTTDSVIINKDAIKEFSTYELNWLNSLTLNPQEEIEVKRGLNNDQVIDAVLPKEEDNQDNNQEDEEVTDSEITKDIPIQIYTNFNYLGINRDSETTNWSNEDDSHRDVGIFMRKGSQATTDEEKNKYSNLLFDLKSFIVFDDIALYNSNASSQLKKIFSKKNLENIKYFVVKESYDSQIHHLISEEQGLEELTDGEIIYTLQARLKNKQDQECTITLGVLPKSTNLHEEITSDSINRKISRLQKSKDNEDKISKLQGMLSEIESGNFARNYQEDLDGIEEQEIDKPTFTGVTGLGKVRSVVIDEKTGEKKTVYHKIRLNEVNSDKSRFGARSSNYVVSPIYTSMDPNDPPIKKIVNGVEVEVPSAGKPIIFVSARRIYNPTELADRYEEQIASGSPSSIRRIVLDAAGVSFESLFDQRYANTFKSGAKDNYTFPFDALPTGIRMYTALHNFRANLRKFNDAVKNKFGDDLISLEKILKEESRLYYQYKGDEEVSSEINFRQWVKDNQSEIQNDITLEQIQSIWDFNDNDLKNIKQFRLGYNQENGVYVRNISDGYLGNYINPQVAKQYLGTIEKVFEVLIDQIIPKNSVDPSALIDYRVNEDMFKEIEKNWVNHIENSSNILLNIVEDNKVIPITINPQDRIKALPFVLVMATKFLQARQRMKDPDELFKGYDIVDSDSPYKVKIGDSVISYLDILKGGLGDIRSGRPIEPGVVELKEGQSNSDLRLLNMFNIAFHGTVATGGNDFTKPVRKLHAKDVLFPNGIFVDPIRAGKYDSTRKYRLIATNPKYYLTNIGPSGAKVYISLKKKSAEIQKNNVETNIPKSTISILHQNLNNIAGKEIDVTGTVQDNQELLNLTNTILLNKMSEIYFSDSGRFNSPEDLLNVTSYVELDKNENIKEVKIKDYDKLKNADKFVQIQKQSNGYLLTTESGKMFEINLKGDKVIINESTQQNNEQFSRTILDALNALENINLLDHYDVIIKKATRVSKKSYNTFEAFETAFNKFVKDINDQELSDLIKEQNLLDRIKNNQC